MTPFSYAKFRDHLYSTEKLVEESIKKPYHEIKKRVDPIKQSINKYGERCAERIKNISPETETIIGLYVAGSGVLIGAGVGALAYSLNLANPIVTGLGEAVIQMVVGSSLALHAMDRKGKK
ncbi:MAG: hypothetical protein NTW30_02645 [Candidatus Aenigmarchaeota archaeon]|nr:hypothetical protein [Candidatus Aenigmarchaeota archaeon]